MKRRRVRVFSYNIHKGFAARNRGFVLAEVRKAISELAPDILFLQEVVGEHRGHERRIRDWPVQSQFEYLAGALWPHFAYGRNAVYDEGHHGNAILSKFPILNWENEDVSTSTLERRGLLHAVVRPHEDRPELNLICVHFGLLERDRAVQAQRLCDRIRKTVTYGQGLVVAGDFNDWSLKLSPLFRREIGLQEAYYVRHRHHARTFPARMPVFRLDRVYFHGLESRHARVLHREPWRSLSDHVPLLVDFQWA